MPSRAPLLAALGLLLLPPLYVGSYFAVVVPTGMVSQRNQKLLFTCFHIRTSNYRCGGTYAARLYLPLETIDRKVRPAAWRFPLGKKVGLEKQICETRVIVDHDPPVISAALP